METKQEIMKKRNIEFKFEYSFDEIEKIVEINRISWNIMFDKLYNFNLGDKDYDIYLKNFMKLNKLTMVDYDEIKYDLIDQFGSKNISECFVRDCEECLIIEKEYYDDDYFVLISTSLRDKNLNKIKQIV